jgi:hypothetical protein
MEKKKLSFKDRLMENLLKNNEIKINELKYNEESESIESKKLKCTLINSQEIKESFDDFIYKNDKNKFEEFQQIFEKTQYNINGSFGNFYTKLKKFNEFTRKKLLDKKTPSFNFIKALKENNLVTNPIGILKREGEENVINLNNMKMGDDYIKCLGNSLKVADHLTELHLSGNRLTNQGIAPIISSLTENHILIKKMSVLDLSYNKLGSQGIKHIISFVKNDDCELSHLNLEANCLGNMLIEKLINEITKNLSMKMKYLNLGQNNLNDDICLSLANMIDNCKMLEVLILYWNQFKNYGASQIISKLKNHHDIKILDLGWNLIGTNLLEQPTREELNKLGREDATLLNLELEELKVNMEFLSKKKLNSVKNNISLFAKELGQLFNGDCKDLVHLDISHNNIGFIDSQYISQEVKFNHSILGIHLDGNDMTIDSLGFIKATQKENLEKSYFANSQVYYKIDNEHPLIKSNILNVRKIRAKNSCWICEGWREIKFSYKPINQENAGSYKVKLHLSFEDYKATEMLLNIDVFVNYRMCPPGEYYYYYTVNGEPVENYGNSGEVLKDAIIHVSSFFI